MGRSQTFVPWTDGKLVNASNLSSQLQLYGYTAFQFPLSFAGDNVSGNYIIQNNTDSYLFVLNGGNVGNISPNNILSILSAYQSGIYSLNTDNFTCLCLCAGLDFSTKRFNGGVSYDMFFNRSILSFVDITAININENPATLPGPKTSFIRTYDFQDLFFGQGSIYNNYSPLASANIILLAGQEQSTNVFTTNGCTDATLYTVDEDNSGVEIIVQQTGIISLYTLVVSDTTEGPGQSHVLSLPLNANISIVFKGVTGGSNITNCWVQLGVSI